MLQVSRELRLPDWMHACSFVAWLSNSRRDHYCEPEQLKTSWEMQEEENKAENQLLPD